MSETSLIRQVSEPSDNNQYNKPKHKQNINHSYTFSKTFIGLGINNNNILSENNSGLQANQSSVLNWLFGPAQPNNTSEKNKIIRMIIMDMKTIIIIMNYI